MKIILTLPSLQDPGGVAGFYRSVLPRLTEKGVEVSTLEIGSTRGAFGLFHPVRDQIELSARIRREGADLVHVNPSLDARSFFRDGLFVRQALNRGMPVVVFFHGWKLPFEATVDRRLQGFFRATFGGASVILCLSEGVARKLRAWGARAPVRVTATAIPDDLVAGFSLQRKQRQARTAGPARILFLARLERAKGIIEALQAVSLLTMQGLDVTLDVAGSGGAEDEARSLASVLPGLEGRVRFHGYVQGEQKKALLEKSHLYCFPSHTEGMPLSILEAFAFGLPVVTRCVGGIGEFFQNGVMGYAAQSADPGEIAGLLKKVLTDQGLMQRMSRHNHEWAMARCMASASADRLLEAYREVRQQDSTAPRKASRRQRRMAA
jgi:glycosyltransferase involved in cell wall biosynthesis